MTDTDQTPLDLDTLSDEEFLKLDPNKLQPFVPPESESNESTDNNADSENNASGSEAENEDSGTEAEANNADESANNEPFKSAPSQTDQMEKPASSKKEVQPAPESETKPDGEKPEGKKPEETPEVIQAAALDFYKQVTAPFKADGKDIQVRSPEDAIRLMQMGVNYSRRMQEMKPIRAQHEMLKAQGLDNPDKLNFMIEVMKGKTEAIQKLLKDNKIDGQKLGAVREGAVPAVCKEPLYREIAAADVRCGG